MRSLTWKPAGLLTTLLLGTAALALPAAVVAAPSPADYCNNKCSLQKCSEPCYDPFTRRGTTCGQFLSNFPVPRDLDGDGLVTDNCPCTANPDQADCDGDGKGDVCDSQNVKWVLVDDLGECMGRWNICNNCTAFPVWMVEAVGQKRYRNLCDGAYCYDRYVSRAASCDVDFVYPGDWTGGQHCCAQRLGTICNPNNTCNPQECPF